MNIEKPISKSVEKSIYDLLNLTYFSLQNSINSSTWKFVANNDLNFWSSIRIMFYSINNYANR